MAMLSYREKKGKIPAAKAMLLEDKLETASDQLQPLIGHSIQDT
jgi:hypothetical protein